MTKNKRVTMRTRAGQAAEKRKAESLNKEKAAEKSKSIEVNKDADK